MFLKEKSVCALVDAEYSTDIQGIVPGLHCRTEDDHIHRYPNFSPQECILANSDELSLFFRVGGLVGYLCDLAPDKDRPLFLASAVELLVPLSKAPHVDIKFVDFRMVPNLFLDQMGVLQSIHATNPGAVFVVVHVPAADTVQQSHTARSTGKLPVFVPDQDLAAGGSGGIAQSLKLKRRVHIGESAVPVLFHGSGIHEIIPGGQDDAAGFHLDLFLLLGVIDGNGFTDSHTFHAFAADAAVQATKCFLLCLFL